MEAPLPGLRHLFTLKIGSSAIILGKSPVGFTRRVSAITGGLFDGDRLRGTVLPGGGDWVRKRADGVMHMDVRVVLKADDGAYIYMTYTGRYKPDDGSREEGSAPYFRSLIEFETAEDTHGWLNDIVALGSGSLQEDGPVYQIFEVL